MELQNIFILQSTGTTTYFDISASTSCWYHWNYSKRSICWSGNIEVWTRSGSVEILQVQMDGH